jgi:hypothetical protein
MRVCPRKFTLSNDFLIELPTFEQILDGYWGAISIVIWCTPICSSAHLFTYNACSTYLTCLTVRKTMAHNLDQRKQNVTISLSAETIRKAKVLAAQRSTSISGLLAAQIESLVGTEELYERSERAALALLETGFHLGGVITASRDEWHER